MASIKFEECPCPRRQKATCAHKPWRVAYREPGGRTGKIRQTSFKTQDEAKAFAIKVERDKDLGVYISPKEGARTFEDVWLQWKNTGTLEASSHAGYDSVYRNHYGPMFGTKPIGSITKSQIAEWRADQEARGYTAYGIQTRENVLSSVFNYAVNAEIIGRNPCRGANPRKNEHRSAYRPVSDDEVPETEEVLGIIAEAPKIIRLSFWGMSGCGMRPGESLATSEKSILSGPPRILINHQVTSRGLSPLINGNRGVKKGTKHRTFEESRTAPLPDFIGEMVDDHVDMFGTWGEEGWLYQSPRRLEAHPSYAWLLSEFHKAAEAAGCPQYTPKSFRHFFVKTCIFAGIPMYEIAQWLGHRDSRTTERVYAHITKEAYQRGADKITDRLVGEIIPFRGVIRPRPLVAVGDDMVPTGYLPPEALAG